VGLVIIRLARAAPDEEHPYGHHKFETVATFAIAGFLLVTAFEVAVGAAKRLLGWSSSEVEVTSLTVGVMVAIYLNEYSNKAGWFYRFTRLAVSNLSGVPSIVFGLFGLGFFVKFVGGNIDRLFYGGSLVFGQPAIIWASLTLAVLTMPVVILSTEETLRAIPNELREASLALGATKFQTIVRVVLPHSLSGIITGGILAVSRGAGEVAPILFTGAAYFLPDLPSKLNSQFMELGYHIYVLSTQSPNVEETKPILYSTVFVLLALTFSLNLIAIFIRSHMRASLRRAL